MSEEKTTNPNSQYYKNQITSGVNTRTESHLIYELKQKREYLIRQLMDIQQAIDAVNRVY